MSENDPLILDNLALSSGEARTLDTEIRMNDLIFSGERFSITPTLLPVRVDVSRTTHHGYALRLRFAAQLTGGFCMRCLDEAKPQVEVDSREVEQPGEDEELASPYVDDQTNLDIHHWVHDALILALPEQILCQSDCAGLCPKCGVNLNLHPEHEHEPERDPRWAKLSELQFDQ